MNILTLSTKDSFGGAGRVAFRLCEEIIKEGYDDTLLVNSKRTTASFVRLAPEFHDPKSFQVDRIKTKIKEWQRKRRWNKYPNRLDKVFFDIHISYLKNALKAIDFDLLHLHWVGENFVDFTELPTNKPIVWTLHDCFAFTGVCSYFEDCEKYETHCEKCPQLNSSFRKDISYKTFNLKKERYSNLDLHIVSPSRWLAEAAKKSFLLNKYPITVIHNGINTKTFRPIDKQIARKEFSIDQNKKVILFGAISAITDPRKGGDILYESLKLLKEQSIKKDDILFLIFGSEQDDSYSFDFECKYLGYIQDEATLNTIYNVADVMVVPSRHENLPNTILESLSAGTPVVAFDIGGNSDMIEHKKNGYLATPFNTQELANGISYCLDNNNENQLSSYARKTVSDKFKIEMIAKQYIDLYKKISNND